VKIDNVSAANPGFFLDIVRIQNSKGDRVAVPVDPANTVYARFKHVLGVPSRNGGTPLFRLQVLDNLIDRLLRYSEQVPSRESLKKLDAAGMDALIPRLQNQLHNHLLQLPSSFGGAFPETGMLIDLIA
jgi:hypothetical protein